MCSQSKSWPRTRSACLSRLTCLQILLGFCRFIAFTNCLNAGHFPSTKFQLRTGYTGKIEVLVKSVFLLNVVFPGKYAKAPLLFIRYCPLSSKYLSIPPLFRPQIEDHQFRRPSMSPFPSQRYAQYFKSPCLSCPRAPVVRVLLGQAGNQGLPQAGHVRVRPSVGLLLLWLERPRNQFVSSCY